MKISDIDPAILFEQLETVQTTTGKQLSRDQAKRIGTVAGGGIGALGGAITGGVAGTGIGWIVAASKAKKATRKFVEDNELDPQNPEDAQKIKQFRRQIFKKYILGGMGIGAGAGAAYHGTTGAIGGRKLGDLSYDIAHRQEKGFDSPSAGEYYKKNFSPYMSEV